MEPTPDPPGNENTENSEIELNDIHYKSTDDGSEN